jgi:hypothetical protein
MTRFLRLFATLVLILAFCAGTGVMAVARAQAAGPQGQDIVICSGYGVVTITVDAEGNPVSPVHPCPECVAGLAAALVPSSLSIAVPVTLARFVPDPKAEAWHILQTLYSAQARGPPLAI